MAPNLFNNSNRESTAVKYFEIRLDESHLTLRGSEDEASSVLLKGTLVLCLSEPLRIQGVRLRFTGEKRIGWFHVGSGPANIKHLDEFLRHTWDFKKTAETLPAGNYEWPFEKIIPGNSPESLEGLTETWIVYRMKATVERGMLQQNSVARKQVRIIRTLDPAALELAHAMSVENVWIDKISYSLSTTSKAVVFGSTIQVDFKLIPLLKGLKIGRITTELLQRQSLTIRNSRNFNRHHSHSHAITTDEYRLADSAETEDIEGQEGYVFSRSMPLPQSLRKCVQTLDALDIKIRHHLAFNIQLHNPDGHVSELHANVPVYIFLSPNLPIDDNNNLVHGSGSSIALAASELTDLTPPQYGEHTLDQLYSDIDPSGYMTPGGASGVGTPLGSRSRSGSVENLASMDGMATTGLAANVLESRLSNLDVAGPAGSYRVARERAPLASNADGSITQGPSLGSPPQLSISTGNGYFAERMNGTTPQTPSEAISRQDSGEEVEATPQHLEYQPETLAKVPSYKTALQTNYRLPLNEGLPTYQAATRPTASSSRGAQMPIQRSVRNGTRVS